MVVIIRKHFLLAQTQAGGDFCWFLKEIHQNGDFWLKKGTSPNMKFEVVVPEKISGGFGASMFVFGDLPKS